MFKNTKLSTKISLGFTLILIISAAIGVFTIINMNNVNEMATKTEKEYMEEVSVTSNLLLYGQNLAFEIRGYSLSNGNITYYNNGMNELSNLKNYVSKAKNLASEYSELVQLKESADIIEKNVNEYASLIEETKDIFDQLSAIRTSLDSAAQNYIKNAGDYLESMNISMNSEISENASPDKLKERLTKITFINNIIDNGNEIRVGNFKAQLTKDYVSLEKLAESFKDVFSYISQLKSITVKETNKNQLDIIKKSADNYESLILEIVSLYKKAESLTNKREVIVDQFLKNVKAINEVGINTAKAISSDTVMTLSTSIRTTLIGIILAIVVGTILAVIIIRSITKPVGRIVEALNQGSQEVASASEQLSSSSQQLAEGSAEQAASIEETSSTLEESSSMVAQNSENTKQAAALSEKANESSTEGFEAMKEMIKAMDELKTSSDEISKIIKVIDDIAFQTNILALNAAVEAARAGEAGQGFAVVAEEVRNLAQRSAKAANDTSEMIEKNIKLSEKGVTTSAKVKNSLEGITDQSRKVKELMDEIAAASQEQAQGIMQINKAISQMDQVTQQIASNAEESASASEELSSQAISMSEVVDSLVSLVYGKNAQKKSLNSTKPSSGPKKPAKNYTTQSKVSSKPKKTEIIDPEKIIPLEDDSSDF